VERSGCLGRQPDLESFLTGKTHAEPVKIILAAADLHPELKNSCSHRSV